MPLTSALPFSGTPAGLNTTPAGLAPASAPGGFHLLSVTLSFGGSTTLPGFPPLTALLGAPVLTAPTLSPRSSLALTVRNASTHLSTSPLNTAHLITPTSNPLGKNANVPLCPSNSRPPCPLVLSKMMSCAACCTRRLMRWRMVACFEVVALVTMV